MFKLKIKVSKSNLEIHAIDINSILGEANGGGRQGLASFDERIRRGAGDAGLSIKHNAINGTNGKAIHGPLANLDAIRVRVAELLTPQTQTHAEWHMAPTLPIVVKAGTKGPYLLEEAAQADRFNAWQAASARMYNGHSPLWVCKEFVQCPGERWAIYCVVTDCTGAELASELKYSHAKDVRVGKRSAGVQELEDPAGPFFLNSRDIAANRPFREGDTEAVGGSIVLGRTEQSHPIISGQAEILAAHGLDREDPQTPALIREQSAALAQELCVEGGVVKRLWVTSSWIQGGQSKFYFIGAKPHGGRGAFQDLIGDREKITKEEALAEMLKRTLGNLTTSNYSTEQAS